MDNKLLRACLAELIGTFALVFVGAGVVCVANLTSEPRLDATAVAFAEGLTLAVALTTTLRGSGGGLNPALTLMLWVFRRIDGRKLLGFVAGQLVGALLAGMCLRLSSRFRTRRDTTSVRLICAPSRRTAPSPWPEFAAASVLRYSLLV